MPGNEILDKSWCDKVFEHRNKNYGAYRLRQTTGRRNATALGCLATLILSIVAPIVIVSLIMTKPVVYKKLDQTVQHIDGVKIKEARPIRKPAKKSEPEPGEKEVNIVDIDPVESMLENIPEEIAKEEEIVQLTPDSLSTILKEQHLDVAHNDERTEGLIIDSIPHYPGGIACFMKWLDSTMVYPPACVREKIEGTVVVAFIVDTDGHISDPRVIKGSHRHLNNEALRTLHLMKPWKPAIKHGKAIKAQVTVPIVFSLN